MLRYSYYGSLQLDTEKSLPLKHSKIYNVGRASERSKGKNDTGPVNDIIIKNSKFTRRAGHLQVEEWQRYIDTKTGEIVSLVIIGRANDQRYHVDASVCVRFVLN